MKRFAPCIAVGMLLVGLLCPAGAQQAPAAVRLSPEACAAVQQYVARIDASRSMNAAADREETYAQARKGLEPVLQRNKQAQLLDVASDYAKVSETIVKASATDPKLPELVDKRLKLRSRLLDHCLP
jgi:hypothetical protein